MERTGVLLCIAAVLVSGNFEAPSAADQLALVDQNSQVLERMLAECGDERCKERAFEAAVSHEMNVLDPHSLARCQAERSQLQTTVKVQQAEVDKVNNLVNKMQESLGTAQINPHEVEVQQLEQQNAVDEEKDAAELVAQAVNTTAAEAQSFATLEGCEADVENLRAQAIQQRSANKLAKIKMKQIENEAVMASDTAAKASEASVPAA